MLELNKENFEAEVLIILKNLYLLTFGEINVILVSNLCQEFIVWKKIMEIRLNLLV